MKQKTIILYPRSAGRSFFDMSRKEQKEIIMKAGKESGKMMRKLLKK